MYMSPEQVSGRLEIDHRTDVYTLGLVLYEMLTLWRPIEAGTREGVLRQVMTKSRPPVGRKNPAVSRDLESVVHRAMAHDPDDRYQSAAALATDLQNVIDRKPVIAPPYRYKADLREIPAERPGSVAFISILLIVSEVVGFPNHAVFMVITELFKRAHLSPQAKDCMRLISAAAFSHAPLVASVCLYLGYAWARWVLSVYLGLVLASLLWVSQFEVPWGSPVQTAMLICGLPGIFAILFRRATRDWLRLAGRLRAEQRGWRLAARE
jgi:hypothetical protein